MEKSTIRVGFDGVTPGRSWAARTHINPVCSLREFEIVAMANSNLESSRVAATAFDIPHAHSNVAALAQDTDVDLLTIIVKVLYHKELIDVLLDAIRMFFCEWPPGNGFAEAEPTAARARQMGVRTVVGLQARCSPTVRYVRGLIRDCYLGDVLSTMPVGPAGRVWGASQTVSIPLEGGR